MMNAQQSYLRLLEPSESLISEIKSIEGDILMLGAGGKMGPSMAVLAREAISKAGVKKEVIAVSRFSDPAAVGRIRASGAQIINADLLDDDQLQRLPDVPNVIYLAGMKFGTTGKEPLTWAMNAYLPGRVAEKYKRSRIVVFSTGNVYPLVAVDSGGATERQPPGPVGEYAQSCLGRERIFQYFSSLHGNPVLIFRLNYAIDAYYGVLLDLAKSVMDGRPVDLRMGHVNVIWQGDANEFAIRSILHCTSPPKILNVTGSETLAVRDLASRFGEIFGVQPKFINDEQPTALLNNASESFRLFGKPRVTIDEMVSFVAAWLIEGGQTMNKPTHFQEREGQF